MCVKGEDMDEERGDSFSGQLLIEDRGRSHSES